MKTPVLGVLVAFSLGMIASCTSRHDAGRQYDVPELVLQADDMYDVRTIAFSPNGRWIASGSLDGQVRLWDARTGKLIKPLKYGEALVVATVAFSPDSKTLAIGNNDGEWDNKLRLLSLATGAVTRSWTDGLEVDSAAFSPDGKTIAAAIYTYNEDGQDVGLVVLYDTRTAKLKHKYKVVGSRINSVAFSPNGKYLAGGLYDNAVMLWSMGDGKPARRLEGNHYVVYSVAFSSDSRLLIAGGGDQQSGEVILWDAAAGSLKGTLSTPGHWVRSVAYSPDGKLFASGGGEGNIMLWDPQTGKVTRKIRAHNVPVRALAFSPDGSRLVSAGGGFAEARDQGDVRIWQVRDDSHPAR
jgi:WD40 repeat protein